MRRLVILLFIIQSTHALAQNFSFEGMIVDEKGQPLPYATSALLDPGDSTLAFYGVANTSGNFSIRNIKGGAYVLQISFLGFQTFYRAISFPSPEAESKTIVLKPTPINLPSAEVNAERIPILLRGDTIEYNASSYKTAPDAVAEELLKKLPGVAVDRNGNIKAQGEDVKKVTVDGKEFFGNDPKVATKNLPADAIDKVQVFDTKSDQAELTGINDGKRDKTINLQLKDDKKNAWFGEVEAGAGTDEHFQANAKAYRFTPERQIALLGMLNNINKFGFSFSDYMNFNGGFRGNGELSISSDENSFPIDFGEIQKGLITSGGAGANYSLEKRKDNRFNVSYLANGINKKQHTERHSTNFTEADEFLSDEQLFEKEENRAHRINFGWKNRIDSLRTLTLGGQGSFSDNSGYATNASVNSVLNQVLSSQNGTSNSSGESMNGSLRAVFLNKLLSSWKLFLLESNASWKHSKTKENVNSLTRFFTPPVDQSLNQFQRNTSQQAHADLSTGLTRKTGDLTFVEGNLEGAFERSLYKRQQGKPDSDIAIDSLSNEITQNFSWMEPVLRFKRVNEKSQFTISAGMQFTESQNIFANEANKNTHAYFKPSLSWDFQYRSSHRLRLTYDETVVAPQAKQLFPMVNYFDPLNLVAGNRELKPEHRHDARFHWSIFDQFSFTSFFTGLRFSYVTDKISWSKRIDENLVQHTLLLNVPEDYEGGWSAEFSTPVRALGINVTISADERWNQSLIFINDALNRNSSFTHEAGISFDNRKKNKWDASTGVTLRYSNSQYSLMTNSTESFLRTDYFADVSYDPSDHWHFSAKADVSHYYGRSFDQKLNIPLLQAEAAFTFLKHNRGVLTLTAFDLLDRNTGIDRFSEFNYLLEERSDIIQRYVMLSFKFKLNKFTGNEGVDIKVNGR